MVVLQEVAVGARALEAALGVVAEVAATARQLALVDVFAGPVDELGLVLN